ncbi:thiamine-phosphate kinase [Halobacteriales archaeon QS_3_64_16]|nr:MAG: thiamine-phosphate kinase [Halobacteriales archaeon QS_3_64_16]
MGERDALESIAASLPAAGDDAAVVGENVLTTDMLHANTDFPAGTSRYTAGWRSVGASLSDLAAMGAEAVAAVAAYGAPTLEERELSEFLAGAKEVCTAVGAEYVGGDLDAHEEFTVATTALGEVDEPVYRSGAQPGDTVYLTGTLGRSAAALRLFNAGELERANDLFRFSPRVEAGVAIAPSASAMMDSSDGLARSAHQLAEASNCGLALESPLPIDERLEGLTDPEDARELGTTFGEDFELLFTVPEDEIETVESTSFPVDVRPIGRAVEEEITLDGDSLADRGYDHG